MLNKLGYFLPFLILGLMCRADYQEISSSTELEQVLQDNKEVVVTFHATRCAACKAFEPIFEQVSDENHRRKFIRIDIDNARDIAQKYGVHGVPMTLFFKDGNEVGERVVGTKTSEKFKEHMRQVLD